MYPVQGSTQAGRHQNDIADLGVSRRSETTDFPAKSTSDDLTNVPVDEVRLSNAVHRILASSHGVVNSSSAVLLASKVTSSDPALAKQAFGRIMSAVTFSLLSPADDANAASEKRIQDAEAQDSGDTTPKFADKGDPAAPPATDVPLFQGGMNEKPNMTNTEPTTSIDETTPQG